MKKRAILPYIVLIMVGLFLMLPIIITCVGSFTTSWTKIVPNGWTTKYYEQTLRTDNFWPSVVRGLVISIIPVIISGLFVMLALYTAILYFPWVDKLMQTICMLPHTLKGVLLAISVLTLYSGNKSIFSDRIFMLTMVYCVTILPYVYQGIRNNLNAINVHNLVEAAEILGASKFVAFFKVVVPNMISGILVSALLSMSIIFSDFAIVKILAGSKYMTAQQLLYNSRHLPQQLISVIVLILFAIVLVISIASFALENRSKKQKTVVNDD